MRISTGRKRLVALFLLVCVGVGSCNLLRINDEYWANQRLIEQGIYEVGNTFTYVQVDNSLSSIFMVCEPPNDNDKLRLDVLKYIEEHNIVLEMKGRMPEGFRGSYIDLAFVEPSSDFPVGWNGGRYTGGYLFRSRITDYLLLSVSIPWDAHASEEYLFYFHNA